MAITGCPNPQKDHAVRMVRFARDCLSRLQSLLPELAETLGEDTKSLDNAFRAHWGLTPLDNPLETDVETGKSDTNCRYGDVFVEFGQGLNEYQDVLYHASVLPSLQKFASQISSRLRSPANWHGERVLNALHNIPEVVGTHYTIGLYISLRWS